MTATGVVAALAAEARTLGTSTPNRGAGVRTLMDGTLVIVSGMGSAAAAAATRELIEAGATSLVSWGLAGGLDPRLAAGTICIPESVAADSGSSFPTEHHRRELLSAALAERCSVVGGTLFTSPTALESVADKAAAYRRTGAVAVDMESAAIAAVAAAGGLPFIALRAIVDTAHDELPEAVLRAGRAGEIQILALLRGLARAPSELAPLLRLAGRYRAAMRSLTAVARTGALAPLSLAASTVRIA